MRIILTITFCCFALPFLAQQSLIYEQGSLAESIQMMEMPEQDNAKLRKENTGKEFSALTFAKAIDVNIDCNKEGTWESIPNEKLMWRLIIHSQGASSLNLAFEKYIMPKNGQMVIYSANREFLAGPFTDFDNKTNGQLWSPIIRSDKIIVQVTIPKESLKELQLVIGKVNHGFQGTLEKSFSQSCHLDVLCGTADGFSEVENYRDAIRSIGVYSIDGTRLCSGALINNTKDDCRPYFLTANHCGVRPENANTVVIHWNFENQTCRLPNSTISGGPGNGRLDIVNSGVKILAFYQSSDMQLLELDNEVPVEANPFFAGWNISNIPPANAACIHHPNADEKRISFENNTLSVYEDNNKFWYVENWEIGSTEGGSSGAPLFNSDLEIVGQLFGGDANCGNNLWDIFGRIDQSWVGDGTVKGGLKSWLDPENSGVTRYPGRNCSALLSVNEPVVSICNRTTTTHSVILSANNGFTAAAALTYTVDIAGIEVSFERNTIMPNNTVIANISVGSTVKTDNYELKITANQNATQAHSFITLEVSKSVPTAIKSISPTPSGTVGTQLDFEWKDDYNTYDIEVSKNSNFSQPHTASRDINNNFLGVKELQEETIYFWRVRGVNACGIGEWTNFSFETGKILCLRYTSADLPQTIEETGIVTVKSIINVPENRTITDVNVISIEGKHSWVGDLQFRLISPSGREISLINQNCDKAKNFFVGFDDEAKTGVICPINDSMIYQPILPLSPLKNEFSGGSWALWLIDLAELDGGTFNKWEIEICTNLSKNTVPTDDIVENIIKTYPNPAGDILYIVEQENIKNPYYSIYNAVGAQMKTGEMGASIDVSDLQNGIYFLQIRDASKIIGIKKIIISK
ncbi:MAG: T9SS type A sorting domain-containing protein [Saprospiraceae bacterium]